MRDPQGADRWPVVPVEILFNILMLLSFAFLRRRAICPGQHYHVYLIAYGLFRFVHEFVRDTPRMAGPFSVYHLLAAGTALFGLWAFRRRLRAR